LQLGHATFVTQHRALPLARWCDQGLNLAAAATVRNSPAILRHLIPGEGTMDEILINTNMSGDQNQPGVAGFRGTQFVVVWADQATGDIKGQMFGVNGVQSSVEFLINFPGPPGTKRRLPAMLKRAKASLLHG